MERHDAFIGRWVIFHKGHMEIINKVYTKNKRPILIMIMDTHEETRAEERSYIIRKTLNHHNIPHSIVVIPPISSVNWGRNVGYETNYIEVDEDIKEISGTNIREKKKKKDNSWKDHIA